MRMFRRIALTVTLIVALIVLIGCTSNVEDGQAAVAGSAAQSSVAPAPGEMSEYTKNELRQINQLPPNSKVVKSGNWKLQVFGDTSRGQMLRIKASGFPPNGHYRIKVIKPDGSDYKYLVTDHRFDDVGGMTGWKWNALDTETKVPDPPGIYILTVTDTTPGSPTIDKTVDVLFTVKKIRL